MFAASVTAYYWLLNTIGYIWMHQESKYEQANHGFGLDEFDTLSRNKMFEQQFFNI